MAFTVPREHSRGFDAHVELVSVGTGSAYLLLSILFLHLGIPNNRNNVLIRRFMKCFAVTRFQASLIESSFYLGYFLSASPAELFTRKFGFETTIIPRRLLLFLT